MIVVRVGIDKVWEIMGIRHGYAGLITNNVIPLGARDVSGIIQQGGPMLGSARCPEFKTDDGRLPLPPDLDWTSTLIAALSDAERELARLTTLAGNFPFPRLLVQPFIRREAVLSSRIEGTRASLTDLYNYESAQLSFLEPNNDVREVHNYVLVLDYGLERLKTLPVSLRLIRELHARLLEGVRGRQLTPVIFAERRTGSVQRVVLLRPLPMFRLQLMRCLMLSVQWKNSSMPILIFRHWCVPA